MAVGPGSRAQRGGAPGGKPPERPSWRVLDRSFYARDSRRVAVELLNKILVGRGCAGRIVEVEAYLGEHDPASHAFRGRTRRNAVMFGPPGHLYVYFTYGMHYCCNAVCGEEGVGTAVLIRALSPLSGIERMWARRAAARQVTDLCSGPAKLTQALGITRPDDGADLAAAHAEIAIVTDGTAPPERPRSSGRIGVSRGAEHPWRWFVAGEPNVSRQR